MRGNDRMTKANQKDAELLINLYSTMINAKLMKSFTWLMELEKQSYEEFIKKNPIGSEGCARACQLFEE
jgi:hypothetical protein